MLISHWPAGRPCPLTSPFLPPSSGDARPPSAPPSAPGGLCRLGPGDGAACLHLDRLALGGLWTAEQWERELCETRRPVLGWRQRSVLVAVASAWLVVDELQITAVAVHPAHRRQGLARQLLEALLLLGRQEGAKRATLEVSHRNAPATALYAGLGFQEVAIRRGYYRNGDDALIQLRKL